MNDVLRIKQKYDLDALLRQLAPTMERNVQRRREQERRKVQINRRQASTGSRLRVL